MHHSRQDQMQQPCEHQPRRSYLLKRLLDDYPQKIRRKLFKLPRWKLIRRFGRRFSPDRPQADVETNHGRRPSSTNLSNGSLHRQVLFINNPTKSALVIQPAPDSENPRVSGSSSTLPDDISPGGSHKNVPDTPDPQIESSELVEYCTSSPVYILVKLPGDGPSNKKQMLASIDNQCKDVNLMDIKHWKRLNEDGRGVLEPVEDEYVKPLKLGPIPVIGIARGLEWQFKDGYRTYTSDFRIIAMDDFDVLLGSHTIKSYQLLMPGTDFRHVLVRAHERDEANRRQFDNTRLDE